MVLNDTTYQLVSSGQVSWVMKRDRTTACAIISELGYRRGGTNLLQNHAGFIVTAFNDMRSRPSSSFLHPTQLRCEDDAKDEGSEEPPGGGRNEQPRRGKIPRLDTIKDVTQAASSSMTSNSRSVSGCFLKAHNLIGTRYSTYKKFISLSIATHIGPLATLASKSTRMFNRLQHHR